MKKLAVGLSLCLLAATAALTLPAAGRSPAKQEVDPDTSTRFQASSPKR